MAQRPRQVLAGQYLSNGNFYGRFLWTRVPRRLFRPRPSMRRCRMFGGARSACPRHTWTIRWGPCMATAQHAQFNHRSQFRLTTLRYTRGSSNKSVSGSMQPCTCVRHFESGLGRERGGPCLLGGRAIRPADPSSLLNGDYSPLRSSQMLVDTALESSVSELSKQSSLRSAAELFNAVSTSACTPDSGEHGSEWGACPSELES